MSYKIAGYIGVCDRCLHQVGTTTYYPEDAEEYAQQCADEDCIWCEECGNDGPVSN